MTKFGETNNFSVQDFANEIEKFLNSPVDHVIYNTKEPSHKRLLAFKKTHPELLELVKFDKDLLKNKKFIGTNILLPSGPINHDPFKLTKIILNLCKP